MSRVTTRVGKFASAPLLDAIDGDCVDFDPLARRLRTFSRSIVRRNASVDGCSFGSARRHRNGYDREMSTSPDIASASDRSPRATVRVRIGGTPPKRVREDEPTLPAIEAPRERLDQTVEVVVPPSKNDPRRE
jgi:hypothetical protein